MQPAEAGGFVWLRSACLCHSTSLQGCYLLGVLVSEATPLAGVMQGKEGNPAAALALSDLRQGMQGQVDQHRLKVPLVLRSITDTQSRAGSLSEGIARLLSFYLCLRCRAERSTGVQLDTCSIAVNFHRVSVGL